MRFVNEILDSKFADFKELQAVCDVDITSEESEKALTTLEKVLAYLCSLVQ
jgi:hypothetical protein|uniref:At5g35738 n=1 Tax=Arabidopsis thaliana TaxID=3702 RepID=Q58CN4_ARATH|nr:At5g35738 [Arabidopsis thaliana]